MGKIVWIASYPKSGNTWMRAFLWNYFRDSGAPGKLHDLSAFAVNESNPERYRQFTGDRSPTELSLEELAVIRPRVQESMAHSTGNVVFAKSHNYLGTFGDYPLYNFQVTGGAIYVVRNPLDVAVSMADHLGTTLDEAIAFMENEQTAGAMNDTGVAEFLSSWSVHVRSWTAQQHPNILVVRYEDMLSRPRKAFLSVLKLLNEPRDPKRLNRAMKLSSFQQLRKQEAQQGFAERSEHSRRFFRSGRRDQWRTALSEQQIDRIIAAHRDQMERLGYLPRSR